MDDEEELSNSFEQYLLNVAMMYDEPTFTSVSEDLLEEAARFFDEPVDKLVNNDPSSLKFTNYHQTIDNETAFS